MAITWQRLSSRPAVSMCVRFGRATHATQTKTEDATAFSLARCAARVYSRNLIYSSHCLMLMALAHLHASAVQRACACPDSSLSSIYALSERSATPGHFVRALRTESRVHERVPLVVHLRSPVLSHSAERVGSNPNRPPSCRTCHSQCFHCTLSCRDSVSSHIIHSMHTRTPHKRPAWRATFVCLIVRGMCT